MKTIRLTTYNIQHGHLHLRERNVIDLPRMAEVAGGTGASIFGFNEVRQGDGSIEGYPDMPKILAGLLGGEPIFGHAIDFGPGMGYGNLLVSRLPILESSVITIPDPNPRAYTGYYETRCVIRAKIDCRGTPLTVFDSHFGLNPDEQENAAATILPMVEREAGPVVLMGDFNLTPDSPVYARLASVLTDAAAATGETGPTYPSDAPERRIDYIFVRGARVLDAHPVGIMASDHLPLTAEIELP